MNSQEEVKTLSSQTIVSDIPLDNVEREKKVLEYLTRINEHVNDEPDKTKERKTCGSCLAFHTPFCEWEYKDYDLETVRALRVLADATACSRYYPFKVRAMREPTWQKRERKMSFEEKVANL
jgi:hypothetical protein